MGAQHQAFRDFAPNSSMISDQSSRAARSLATSMKKFMPMPKKKDQARREGIDVQAPRHGGAHICHAVGQGEGQFLHRGRAGFVHVIAADGNGIEARHLRGRKGDDVGDDAHRRRRRIDIGVAHHEFLEDVVLDGAGEPIRRTRPAPRPRR